ncbi:hypothetical protein NZD89_23155 [Alicyclobacillus fastidiosus]|uniref:Uncharacterized protein n=1 Tax=Alicyclobacillus fastidiosus TaxID=392011 RepID=A0ABY6ZE13_9BACL|nr:hypothetical protein [Alicyclobacillus fastidiosus]WAH41134.1 hypothetical protein NZD89_23155 [Alicyclobacillus fastidiosus]
MRFHALLFAYADERTLQRAIKSLLPLQGRLKPITIFRRSYALAMSGERIPKVPGVQVRHPQ